MQLDIVDFAKKLLSKCISVKVRYFQKSQLDSFIFEDYSDFSSMRDYHLLKCIKQYLKKCKTSTITSVITPFHTQYYILCISKEKDSHLMIGPFLEDPINDNLFFSIMNNLKLNLDYTYKLKSYYQSVPYIDTTTVFEILSTINEYVSETPLDSHVNTIDLSILPKQDSSYSLFIKDINRNSMYKTLESRYADEDKLLSYITSGDIALAQSHIEKNYLKCLEIIRTKDSVRNTKNLLLSANTLFRKAAHNAGVHPIYLDELSGKWAIKIEHSLSFEELNTIQLQMINSYCLLTKKHSLLKYSPFVKQTIEFINLNLSSNLTVKKIASEIGLSPDYLTRLFKKELGVNIITYINQKRIYTSLNLLKTTNLSIVEIGDLIGLNNTSYFYTLFKKQIGISPKQYRSSLEAN
ncbi:AraC family transcriptional regulator [Clostridium cuniculi]|uniref:AraC family transcriptional regulator n=1 Tax=Clostridium cuniculi TaxID=2548455 RepID=UPI001055F312|nr:AraC family transcriptional regulator [Clostridium cuniculi]